MQWYDLAIPRISDVQKHLDYMFSKLKAYEQVKSIYACNEFAEKLHNTNARLRQFDVLLESNFESGDLLAYDHKIVDLKKASYTELEDLGYNPYAILFTNDMLSLKTACMDVFCTSSDDKILHWGPVGDTIEDYKNLQKEAEAMAEEITGFSEKSFKNLTSEQRTRWQNVYNKYFVQYTQDCPQGWYTLHNKKDKFLSSCKKINHE